MGAGLLMSDLKRQQGGVAHFIHFGSTCFYIIKLRKRGRAAEGTGLLNRHISNSIEGSNPSVSAKDRNKCGCSSMVELQLPKLIAWVRFPSPAPNHSF